MRTVFILQKNKILLEPEEKLVTLLLIVELLLHLEQMRRFLNIKCLALLNKFLITF